jgi:hypothetical protein
MPIFRDTLVRELNKILSFYQMAVTFEVSKTRVNCQVQKHLLARASYIVLSYTRDRTYEPFMFLSFSAIIVIA